MADKTKIEWTEATWNPVTGCSIVSPGCTNCYAMRLAGTRLQHHPSRAGLTLDSKAGPVWNGAVRLNEKWLAQPLRWKRPRMIFVCAHGDLFHESVPDAWIDRVFAVMALCRQHTFQVLTKRSARMRAYLSDPATPARIAYAMAGTVAARGEAAIAAGHAVSRRMSEPGGWPLANVWLGVSVEDQVRADARREDLAAAAAAGWTTFASYEPALGPVDWRGWSFLAWLISGGESGPDARMYHPEWFRAARDFSEKYNIAYFHKQNGAWGSIAYNISTGLPAFRQFDTYQHWVNKAPTWVRGGSCIDVAGRPLLRGADFMAARDEGTFPVAILWKVGKKAAGRVLDGRTHDAFPEVAR